MNDVISVRSASRSDIKCLCEINAHVQRFHHEQLPWLFKPSAVEKLTQEFFESLFDNPTSTISLALRADEPAGYVFFTICNKPETALTYAMSFIFVDHLSVKPSCRKLGIGRALMGGVEARALELRVDTIRLDFWTFNDDARRFYRGLGYQSYNEKWWKRTD